MENLLSFDLKDNPELQSALSGKGPGDRCRITIEGTLREIDGKTLVAAVDKVVEAVGIDAAGTETGEDYRAGSSVDDEPAFSQVLEEG